MLTETILEDAGWEALDLPARAEAAARAALIALDLDPDAFEIAVLGCDDARIATLNADFRGKPQPTNVLSWPEEDLSPDEPGAPPLRPETEGPEPHFLGDIAIARETCLAEAREQRLSADHHVTHLIVHGVLHLLGYDHVRDADATLMEALETRILGQMGIQDPYTADRAL
ncbi:probable rRNA maturation factor [Roseivivax lentus]|uniref:Endoribonuclease YbeY n=1 Tax=Roseivivax lentus TaxID=633194 RepID=A0A1N7PP16_9RHOB|nr:rRNA maturation RNase YbeY [Roseivivax lentus]SIT12394.1 probable rRNA maturation factor [Roseivivax lentus]